MEEQRKQAILFAATLLCARETNFAKEYFVNTGVKRLKYFFRIRCGMWERSELVRPLFNPDANAATEAEPRLRR